MTHNEERKGLSGFLNILKPPGMTSHDVVAGVRKLLPRKWKVGHLGTLDPAAAGVLPLAVGSATKLIPLIPDLGDRMKAYLGHIQLGVVTQTDDLEGEVVETSSFASVTKQQLQETLPQFVGEIEQVPPQVSAIRKDGVRAYALARQGETVELKARPVKVAKIDLLEFEPRNGRVKIFMVCGSGTYVRSLARDLGRQLGVGGALAFLLRTHSGTFQLSHACSMEELRREGLETKLIPLSTPFASLPEVSIEVALTQKGQRVRGNFPNPGIFRTSDGLLRVSTESTEMAVVEALFSEVDG